MIPDTKQMDKAALLARVVDQVKHLKRRASEAAQLRPAVPPEAEEVSDEFCCTGDTDDDDRRLYIKASVSCDDRPDLVAGLIQALHGLRLLPPSLSLLRLPRADHCRMCSAAVVDLLQQLQPGRCINLTLTRDRGATPLSVKHHQVLASPHFQSALGCPSSSGDDVFVQVHPIFSIYA
uniref:BHLH domain-containing protein n=1 Tax=Aegilops tauschii subsp. strangulata TaxID=200361 RepID=A0A453E587_AEGTS